MTSAADAEQLVNRRCGEPPGSAGLGVSVVPQPAWSSSCEASLPGR